VGGLLPGVDLAVNPNGGVTVNELAAGIQTLRVDPPPGWTLTAAGCDLPSAGANLEWRTASFTVTPGGGGTCTFQADQLNTLTGSDVAVDIATQEGEVNLVFESVSEDGLTTVETSSTGPEIPSGFSLGDPPVFFDISTTAEFSGGVEVCIDYSQMTFEDESRVWLYHYEDDLWVNITDFVDRVNDVICGVTSSFSPFALLAPPNEPPVADPAGPYLAGVSQSFTVDGTGSSDPDGDPMTFEWAFEGTNRSGASVDYTAPATAGIYPVTLTVDDGNGGVVTASTYVVVYDPSAGFVTGGGWINSPEGAYLPDPSLSGKATFGFVAKYKKGSSIPTGTSEFQFSAGDMNFRSSSYEWLVVTGGEAAKFKGVGAINGEGIYKFQIWASDNDQDSFRIRIWTEDAAGTETTIYDNGFDQHLSGGSIVIHTRATST
jgi:hypothetical protein